MDYCVNLMYANLEGGRKTPGSSIEGELARSLDDTPMLLELLYESPEAGC